MDRDLTAEIVVKSSSDLPFDRYAKAMLGRMWGGDLEVMVLSEILSMPIVIRSSSGPSSQGMAGRQRTSAPDRVRRQLSLRRSPAC